MNKTVEISPLLFRFQSRATVTNKSSAVAEMGDFLATIDMGRKVGAAVQLPLG